MAQQFLAQLPRARREELPDGEECMICMEAYGTFPSDNGASEHAVRLPCDHFVGSECIATWLLSGPYNTNTCPLCRRILFAAQVGDFDAEFSDQDDDEYDDGYEDGNNEDGYSDEQNEDGSEEDNEDGSGEDGGDAGDADDRSDGREQTPMDVLATTRKLESYCFSALPRTETESQARQEWFARSPLRKNQRSEDNANDAQQVLVRLPTGLIHRGSLQPHSPLANSNLPAAKVSSTGLMRELFALES